MLGLKGDALNLNTDEVITSNPDDRMKWDIGKGEKVDGGKRDKLSEIGHGQVPFMGDEATAAAVSIARVTQRATVSFAQLRRVSLGTGHSTNAEWCFAQPRGVHKQYATITLILAPRMMMTAYGEVHPSRLRLLRLALYPGSSWSTNVRNRIPAISSTACGRSKTR